MTLRIPSTPRSIQLALVAAALGVAACDSSTPALNPEGPIWRHRPSWSMSLVYRRSLAAASRDETEPYERGRPVLDVAGRRVFVGSSDRGFYAVRAEDGAVLWRFETLGAVQCEGLYDAGENVVYFGSNDGALYKVDADDGRLMWRFSTNAEVAARPILSKGTLYVVNANDTVIAIDAQSGKRRWSQHRTPALGMEVAGYAGALLWHNKVYVGFSDGTVTAFDADTGTERWRPVDLSAEAEEILGDVPQYLDVDTTPVAGTIEGSPVVFVGSYEGGVFALDADTGTQVWSKPGVRGVTDLVLWTEPAHRPRRGVQTSRAGSGPTREKPGTPEEPAPMIPAREVLIASTGTSGLWGLDPVNGEVIWERPLPDGGVSPPEPVSGAILVSTTRHGLYLLSPLDGGVIDGIHTDTAFSMAAAAFGRRAFILTNTGDLLSLHIASPID